MNMNSMKAIKIEPVRKELKVRLTKEAAFKLFTAEIGTWWPLPSHSVGGDDAQTCYFEGRAGGRIYEVMSDGREAEWGRVVTWEPYDRVVFTWYPGRTPVSAQEVTVTFSDFPGGTRVELVHVGWEIRGADAQTDRDGYDMGWDFVLSNYVIAAGA
jgi:uncharacterized protein YndB with AHSA1/START domain